MTINENTNESYSRDNQTEIPLVEKVGDNKCETEKELEIKTQEYKEINNILEEHLLNIEKILKNINESLEGNCFYLHNWGGKRKKGNLKLDRYPELLTKQINLFWSGSKIQTKVCEIGFNAGHSALLFLLGCKNKNIKFTIFDVLWHNYTMPTFEYMKEKFKDVDWEFIKGDSTKEMSKWIIKNKDKLRSYDLVHVDGGHEEKHIKADMNNAHLLVKVGGLIIIDDTMDAHINKYADLYIGTGDYIECKILKTSGYPHRIIQKIK